MKYRYIKRLIDTLCAALAILVTSPILAGASACILITMGRPVVFKQRRIGFKEQEFNIYKFRTMSNQVDASGNLLPDHLRITKLGRFLRNSSIDELPQLWNVIKGDMSLVGPRPLFVSYLPYYTERERIRHQVRPGITGLAQVNGRTELTWEEKLEWDARYAESLSLTLDLQIIARTIVRVLQQRNISMYAAQGPLSEYRSKHNITVHETAA